ncbi:MAG: HU family DNA-binding protein [Prevotella sp.]|jgi:DNA-binding protein HU-beta|uniref:HU family DNA-binding protein n=1 Tax=Segatella cerevisiae TaxID=2053716 RepID=A0ABT1BWV7_9BACT|nr:HU family DNA-binding protein [Segatella cerevisiae]MCH3994998.1 HU family DNA-binding protein [Prevotella sp.]MCI1246791.1 HU family DNA-binding protein [Prevotella sp.]MCO6025315.1 HU family DNA-binding protein [Segatella cerevisiae]
MNKTELIDKIAAKSGLSKSDSKKALDSSIEVLKEALAANDKVQLVGFGTFSVNERPARQGINPATKQKIEIAAKKVVKFKAGAELSSVVNK